MDQARFSIYQDGVHPPVLQPLHGAIPEDIASRLDPAFIENWNKYNVGRLHTHEVPIEEMRKNPQKYTISWGRAIGPEPFRTTTHKCPVAGGEIDIRVYEPAPLVDADGKPKQRGAYINYHGGGWVFGDLEVDSDFCKRLVDGLGGDLVVFDVDYRLAPEYPYPIPVDDSWAAFQWIAKEKAQQFNIDPNRIAVGGASAGGHLATVIAHLCRDHGVPLRYQVLTVPACDLHNVFTSDGEFDSENCPYESYREMEFAPHLTRARMKYFHRHFLGNPRPPSSETDWMISPTLAKNFSNLADALIFTAELDPLRDEGEVYAAKLRAAGTQVELIRVAGAPHVFAMKDGVMESGKKYCAKIIEEFKKRLR